MENSTRYEVLILTVPEITQDDSKSVETNFEKMIQSSNGSVLSFERWGKYKLAFPVWKNDYGVYFLTRFEAPKSKDLIEKIKTFFAVKLEDIVMRTVITALDPKGSLEYQRPRSLEETPAREEGYTRERHSDRPFATQHTEDTDQSDSIIEEDATEEIN